MNYKSAFRFTFVVFLLSKHLYTRHEDIIIAEEFIHDKSAKQIAKTLVFVGI